MKLWVQQSFTVECLQIHIVQHTLKLAKQSEYLNAEYHGLKI